MLQGHVRDVRRTVSDGHIARLGVVVRESTRGSERSELRVGQVSTSLLLGPQSIEARHAPGFFCFCGEELARQRPRADHVVHFVAEALGVVLLIRYQGDIPPAFDAHAHFRKNAGLVVNPAYGVDRRLSFDDRSAKPAHDFDPQQARDGHHEHVRIVACHTRQREEYLFVRVEPAGALSGKCKTTEELVASEGSAIRSFREGAFLGARHSPSLETHPAAHIVSTFHVFVSVTKSPRLLQPETPHFVLVARPPSWPTLRHNWQSAATQQP